MSDPSSAPLATDTAIIDQICDRVYQIVLDIQQQHPELLKQKYRTLQLDIETERFLAKLCTYAIQIKVAFANWRSLGKKDAEFHSRGYELIHCLV